jgi:hypothetical protein
MVDRRTISDCITETILSGKYPVCPSAVQMMVRKSDALKLRVVNCIGSAILLYIRR